MPQVPESPLVLSFDDFLLDAGAGRLFRSGQAVPLTPRAFSLLCALASHPGRLLAKEQLLAEVWEGQAVTDGVIKVAVREIRRALGDSAQQPRYIETVHRRGYRFVATGQVPVAAIDSAHLPSTPAEPPSDPGLVGRERELALLHEGLEKVVQGERQVIFVTGGPGIGKTHLLQSFLSSVASDRRPTVSERDGNWRVASGHCLEQHGAGEPYWPVLEALGRLCRDAEGARVAELLRRFAPTWLLQMPSLLAAGEAETLRRETVGATQARMMREIAEAFEAMAAQAPVVLLLEDLHWSDVSTLDLLSLLARRPDRARLLVLVSYRPGDAALHQQPLAALLHDLEARGRGRELPLTRLDRSETAAFFARRFPGLEMPPAIAQHLQQHGSGNPLFLRAMADDLELRGLVQRDQGRWRLQQEVAPELLGIPEEIRHLIRAQLGRLPEQDQRVLEAAAVAGVEPIAGSVAAALGLGQAEAEEACDRLAERNLMLSSAGLAELPRGQVEGRYRFVHAVHHQVVYESLSEARRVRLHRRIGRDLEQRLGDEGADLAAELAHHFERARDGQRAVVHLRRAADTAARRVAPREAEEHLRRALALVRQRPSDEAGTVNTTLDLLEQRGRARRSAGDLQGAAEDFQSLADLARDRAHREGEIRGLLYLSSVLYWFRRERCLEVVDRAAARAQALDPRLPDEAALRQHVLGYCAHWNLNLRGWRAEDAEACRAALDNARSAGDPARLSLHLVRDVYLRCLESDYAGADLAGEQGLRLALELGDVFDVFVGTFFRAWAQLHAGRWGRIPPLLEQGMELARKNDHGLWEQLLVLALAWLHVEAGDPSRALELCQEPVEQGRRARQESGQLLYKALIIRAEALIAQGKAAEAEDCLREVEASEAGRRDWILNLPLHRGLARCRLARGDLAGAREASEQLLDLASGPGEVSYRAAALTLLLECSLARNEPPVVEADLQRFHQLLGPLAEIAELPPPALLRSALVLEQAYRKLSQDQEAGECVVLREGAATRLAAVLVEDSELQAAFVSGPARNTLAAAPS